MQQWKQLKSRHNCGNSSDASNYRPISILPVLSKIIERHVHDSLYAFLSQFNLFFPRQLGFRELHRDSSHKNY